MFKLKERTLSYFIADVVLSWPILSSGGLILMHH